MITVNKAFELIIGTCPDFGRETVPLEESPGRILRQRVLADRDLPPFNRVCMDGIAIDSRLYEQGKRKFYRQGFLPAGEAPPALVVGPDACMEVMTGAVLPSGTDSVVPYEHITALQEKDGTWYEVNAFGKPGQHVQSKGTDARRGTVLLTEGIRIGPPAIAVLASAGIGMVKVSSLPRVSIICSGDELVSVYDTPLSHQIRQSNGYAIKALLNAYGIICHIHYVRDEPGEIKTLLSTLRDEPDDCIISTGGVSAGRKDYIPRMLEETGGRVLFHKVSQRPGKPLLFGEWDGGKVFFGLPGNPVSCMAACCRYVIPWILEGFKGLVQPAVYARLNEPVSFSPALTYFLPVRLRCSEKAELIAYPLKGRGSGDFASMWDADGFMELPAEKELFTDETAYRIWPVAGRSVLP